MTGEPTGYGLRPGDEHGRIVVPSVQLYRLTANLAQAITTDGDVPEAFVWGWLACCRAISAIGDEIATHEQGPDSDPLRGVIEAARRLGDELDGTMDKGAPEVAQALLERARDGVPATVAPERLADLVETLARAELPGWWQR